MKLPRAILAALSLLFFIPGFARQPQRPAQPAPPRQADSQKTSQQKPVSDREDVVRISVTLVQLDAVVTDKKGKRITDLLAREKYRPVTQWTDFEVVK